MSRARQGELGGGVVRPPEGVGATEPGGVTWVEVVAVFLLWLGIAAVPLRDTLFDGEARWGGFDTVTAQLPWSAGGEEAPRNPALADVGTYFQPMRRHSLDAWGRGEVPLWNRGIYLGVPHIANPQSGALDPQVVIPGLLADRWLPGGYERIAVHVAWIRLAAAGLGAWLLARALGLGRRGAFLASLSFGGSGFGWLWLQHSLGHAAPFLPWILLGLLRAARGGPRNRSEVEGVGPRHGIVEGVLLASLAWCGAILAGHPETAAGIGIASLGFAVALARKYRGSWARLALALGCGTGLAAALWVPFAEYLVHSGAWFLRRAQLRPAVQLDLLTLGAGMVWLGAWWRSRGSGPSASVRRPGTRGAVGFGLGLAVVLGLALQVGGGGVGQELRLLAWPGSFGPPGQGWFGVGTQPEAAIAWVAAPVLALAAVSFVRRPGTIGAERAPGPWLGHRGFLGGLGLVALVLSLRIPAVEGFRQAFAGLALSEPGRWAPVAALCLGLRAGEALEGARPWERRGGAWLMLGVLAISLGAADFLRPGLRAAPEFSPEVPPGFVGFTSLPGVVPDLRHGESSKASFGGWIHGELAVGGARAVLRGHGRDPEGSPERVWSVPLRLSSEPIDPQPRDPLPPDPRSPEAEGEGSSSDVGVPEGAMYFRADHLDLRRLVEGRWLLELELVPRAIAPDLGVSGEPGSVRRVHALEFEVRRPRDLAAIDLFAWLLTLAWLIATPTALARFGIPGLALAQVLVFAEGLHPAVPVSEFYPPTDTMDFLGEHHDGTRVLSSPGVLPANSNLRYGIPSADGYDGLDVASFNHYRPWAQRPGAQGLLDWHGEAMDLDAPAFWMLRVGWLLGVDHLDHPNWERVVGPPDSEVVIHRARRTLPRAVVVTHLRDRGEVLADPLGFDPWGEAFLEDGDPWTPVNPAGEVEVRVVDERPDRTTLEVECDGDGLLVVFDQDFPGWHARVNGARGELRTVNAVFQGLPLEAGVHRVVLEYRPLSWRIGLGLSLASGLLLIAACLRLGRRARSTALASLGGTLGEDA